MSQGKSGYEFLKMKKIPLLGWPGNSPNLNPIENAWNYVKDNLTPAMLTSLPALQQGLVKMWGELDMDFLSNYSSSMPRRLQVIRKKGGITGH